MAEKSSFFTSLKGDRKYKSSDFAEYFSTFIGNGVFPNPSTNLLVTSNGDMTINLSSGFAWINGYMYHNTDNLTLTVEHADSALKRIDRVVLKCDFINREIKAYVKKGLFASNPIAPNLERGVNAYELSVSDILVENGVISIQQSKITDTRLDENVCGIVTQTVKEIETSELYRKLQGYIDERGQDVKDWMESATAQWEIDFNTWFETLKDILSGDVAGNLARRILELENKVDSGLTADNILMQDGLSVEESILNNTDLANQALKKANEAFQRGDNVKTQLVDKLISEGLDVSTNNTFEELIGNIALGKKWALGTGVSSSVTSSFTFTTGTSSKYNYVSIDRASIDFVPSVILVQNIPGDTSDYVYVVIYENFSEFYENGVVRYATYKNSGGNQGYTYGFKADDKVITSSSYKLPYPTKSFNFAWYAFE